MANFEHFEHIYTGTFFQAQTLKLGGVDLIEEERLS